ncbi:MAG: tetratricopeptide repeat protein [Planctomycetota bacterium]|jgi:tetratricopeptide (TPR) repeat protein
MKTISSIAFNRIAFVLVCGAFLIAGAGGCSEVSASSSGIKPSTNEPDFLFENVRNPEPTPKTLYAIAEILAEQGKDAECEIVLRQIIRDHPGYVPAYNSLAELFMRNGRTKEAVAVMLEGIRIYPTDPVLLNNTGMCWMMRREYEKALEMFTQAAGLRPENARYRANMAVALGLLGREEESLALFKQILPEDQAKHNLSILCRNRDASASQAKEKDSG